MPNDINTFPNGIENCIDCNCCCCYWCVKHRMKKGPARITNCYPFNKYSIFERARMLLCNIKKISFSVWQLTGICKVNIREKWMNGFYWSDMWYILSFFFSTFRNSNPTTAVRFQIQREREINRNDHWIPSIILAVHSIFSEIIY